MKAKVKLALPGYAGNMDDMVIYYNSTLNCLIARKKVIPKFTPNNQDLQDIFAFGRKIGLSEGFKADCKEYIKAYNRKFRRSNRALSSWPALWLKMMKAQLVKNPELNLATLTREDVLSMDLPCNSIRTAVQAGLLERVPGSDKLTATI
jgi:hypothetical protein